MLLSLFVYIGTALILFALGKHLELRERRYWLRTHRMLSFWQWEIVLSIIVFGIIAGARYNTGVDHLTYLGIYEGLQQGVEHYRIKAGSIEIGYIYITRFFAQTLNAHYFYYFAFLGMMQIGFVYYALKDKKYLLPIVGAVIMMGPFFLTWMNGIRQVICCCCFVFLVNYIVERKPIHYLVWVLVCTLMHKSALILLPFYFIYLVRLPENKIINVSILLVCTIIGSTPTWIVGLNNVENLLLFLGYDAYADKFDLIKENANQDVAWGPSRMGLFLLSVLAIWLFPYVKKYFKDDKFLEYSFICFFIGVCGYNLFLNTSHIFIRPFLYFRIFQLVIYSYVCLYLLNSKKYILTIIFCFLLFYYSIYVAFKAGFYPSHSNEMHLYHFFFDYNPIYKENILHMR